MGVGCVFPVGRVTNDTVQGPACVRLALFYLAYYSVNNVKSSTGRDDAPWLFLNKNQLDRVKRELEGK
jgi:hypothetical protein